MVLENFLIDADILWDRVGKKLKENSEARAGRKMRVKVINSGIVEDLTGYTLNLGWHSSIDETKFGLDAFEPVDITEGIFEIEYTSGMLSNYGRLVGTLQLVPTTGQPIESNNFNIMVKKSAIDPEAIQSETSFTALAEALVTVNSWNDRIDVVEQDFIDRANNLDATYPTRLVSLEEQLADIVSFNLKTVGFIGDGVTDNGSISFNATNDNKIIVPSGVYLITKTGYAFQFLNLQNITIEGNGATLLVSDKGLLFQNCENVHVTGLKVVRITQAVWGGVKDGITIKDCANVIIEGNDISKFTDNVSINANTETKNVVVRNNRLHRSSEEPVAVRARCHNIHIYENEIFEHLGDGILAKGSKNTIVRENTLHTPCDTNSIFYADMTAGVSNPPLIGGGITCNAEDGIYWTEDYQILSNNLDGTGYGVGIIAGKNVNVLNNKLRNIASTSAIEVFGANIFNPNNMLSEKINIMGNNIDTLNANNSTTAIAVDGTGSVPITDVIISNNIIDLGVGVIAHDGIKAYGKIIVNANAINGYNYAINVKGGAVVSDNILKSPNPNAIGKQAIAARGGCVVDGNIIDPESVVLTSAINIWTDALDNIVTGNKIIYNGTGVAINLSAGALRNIVNNNKVSLTSTGTRINGLTDYRLNNTIDGKRMASASPVVGTWEYGDIVYNTVQSSGNPLGWVCVSAGSPGTWRPFGQVNYRTNAGSPVGVVVPLSMYEDLLDSTNKVWYKAFGTANTDWA